MGPIKEGLLAIDGQAADGAVRSAIGNICRSLGEDAEVSSHITPVSDDFPGLDTIPDSVYKTAIEIGLPEEVAIIMKLGSCITNLAEANMARAEDLQEMLTRDHSAL